MINPIFIIFHYVQAMKDDANAKQKAYIALALNIAAILFHVVLQLIAFVANNDMHSTLLMSI